MTAMTDSNSLISELVHTPVMTIDAGATLRHAAELLRGADIGALAIVDGPELAGIVSERDIVRALGGGADVDTATVREVMSGSPRYLTLADSLDAARHLMLTAGIRHLPVVDDGELVGIVSIRDLAADARP